MWGGGGVGWGYVCVSVRGWVRMCVSMRVRVCECEVGCVWRWLWRYVFTCERVWVGGWEWVSRREGVWEDNNVRVSVWVCADGCGWVRVRERDGEGDEREGACLWACVWGWVWRYASVCACMCICKIATMKPKNGVVDVMWNSKLTIIYPFQSEHDCAGNVLDKRCRNGNIYNLLFSWFLLVYSSNKHLHSCILWCVTVCILAIPTNL